MANNDWEDWEEDYDVPSEWYDAESILFDNLVNGDAGIGSDPYLQDLFDAAMFDPDISPEEREEAYQNLVQYLEDEYDLDFEDIFDWEDYREWYDSAA